MSSGARVVLATRVFAPDANAAAFRLAALVRGLDSAGADVSVVTVKPSKAAAGVVDETPANVNRWPVLRDKGGNVRGYIQYLSFDLPLFFRLFWRRTDVFISEAPPTTGLMVALAAIVRRKPMVYYAADIFSDGVVAVGAPTLVARLMRALEGWVLRRARTVLAVSDDVAQKVQGFGVSVDRVVNVGHGIDTSTFTSQAQPQDVGYDYFVYTGTMSEVHSPQVFITAFAELADEFPDLRIHFFGQGAYKAELQRMASELVPGRVLFEDVVPASQAARWLRGARAALVSLTPGIGYDYAHPTKAYAAAAVGTSVLYAGPDEFARIVREAGLGEAVPHDAHQVASAMRRILSSPTTAQERAERVAWVDENASLVRVGSRGARAVLALVKRSGAGNRIKGATGAQTDKDGTY